MLPSAKHALLQAKKVCTPQRPAPGGIGAAFNQITHVSQICRRIPCPSLQLPRPIAKFFNEQLRGDVKLEDTTCQHPFTLPGGSGLGFCTLCVGGGFRCIGFPWFWLKNQLCFSRVFRPLSLSLSLSLSLLPDVKQAYHQQHHQHHRDISRRRQRELAEEKRSRDPTEAELAWWTSTDTGGSQGEVRLWSTAVGANSFEGQSGRVWPCGRVFLRPSTALLCRDSLQIAPASRQCHKLP